ncbi:MAG TPA: DUF302 domain-containing protein [Bryobacteraceae bacterium]|nr:DUF302 domain-containing protein [Bryobacteraceae bacterium]
MNRQAAVAACRMPEPFVKALHTIRQAIAATDLAIIAELDVSDRIKRQLGLGFAPCRILLVDSPYLLLEAVALDRSAAALLPLHVVVSSHGSETMVHWLNPAAITGAALPAGTAGPLEKLREQLAHALETVAIRDDQYQSVS